MSIRLRLTLWYSFALISLLVVIGFVAVNTFAATLRANVDRALDENALQVIQASSVIADPTQLGTIAVEVPVEADVFQASGLYLVVVNLEGEVFRKSRTVAGYIDPLDPEGIVENATIAYRDVTIGPANLRVLSFPIFTPTTQELLGYLQIGINVNANNEAIAQLTQILFLVGSVGVILAGIVGALLARQALRPIAIMTETAIAITDADDLGRRIPVPRTRDEVGQLANTFNRMLGRLERLFRLQQRFTTDVSHELRTPLTTIRGNLDLMRRTRVCDDVSLDAMQSETERMTRLVGDLLLLAQADTGHTLRREPVSLDTLMLDVYRQMKLISNGVDVRIGEEDIITVMGDPDRLKQVVLNLADNAIRYTPAGGRVTLSLRQEDTWALLSVTDTGPGIAAEHLDHIFERFYRADRARSRRDAHADDAFGSGSGLGLSIVQWIIDNHGGRIDVQSKVGEGSTFTVYLPQANSKSSGEHVGPGANSLKE